MHTDVGIESAPVVRVFASFGAVLSARIGSLYLGQSWKIFHHMSSINPLIRSLVVTGLNHFGYLDDVSATLCLTYITLLDNFENSELTSL